MTEHRWDAATGYCQRCGVQKGSHAVGCWKCTACPNVETSEREVFCWKCGQGEMVYVDGCSAPENMISLQPYLRKRAWERGLIIGGNPNMQPPEGANPAPTAFPASKGGVDSGEIILDAPKTGLFIKHEPIEEKIIVETFPKEPA